MWPHRWLCAGIKQFMNSKREIVKTIRIFFSAAIGAAIKLLERNFVM